MTYLQLLWSFFQVGLFSIGGGYAALPLIQNQVVEKNNWLTMGEFADVITISQMTPGPIAINSATFVGIRIGGLIGAILATLGCVLPSCIIVLILASIYYKFKGMSVVRGILNGLRPAVVALIASAGLSLVILVVWNGNKISLSLKDIDFLSVIIFALALFILRRFKLNPILVMAGAGAIGLCVYPFLL
jgi:chromate transporter